MRGRHQICRTWRFHGRTSTSCSFKSQTAYYVDKFMSICAPNGIPSSSFGMSYPLCSHPPSREPAGVHLQQLVLGAVSGQEPDDVDPNLCSKHIRAWWARNFIVL